MKKIISLWGLFFLMLVLLAGCRKRFDPSGYIQAVLDLSIKGDEEPVKKYVKDTKDIQELKEETMEQWDSSMKAEFEGADVSEAIQQEWKELMLDILKESRYTVEEAEKTEDGYEMQVEVEPITGVFDDLEAPTRERMAAYAKENKEKILDGTIPPEEADDEVSRTYISAVRENMENISYGAPQTVTVEMIVDGEEISFTGTEEVGALMVDISGVGGFDLWEAWREEAGFGPAGYVKALLDMYTQGSTDMLRAFFNDVDEISPDFHSQYWDEAVRNECAAYGLSEDVIADMQEMYKKLVKRTKYTVGEAQKEGDGYTVEVSVEPITGVFDGYVGVIEDAAQEIMDGTSTETNIYDVAFRNLAKTAAENMDNLSYAEPQTDIVQVAEAEDGIYEASDEDLGNVFGQMIAMPDMESLF